MSNGRKKYIHGYSRAAINAFRNKNNHLPDEQKTSDKTLFDMVELQPLLVRTIFSRVIPEIDEFLIEPLELAEFQVTRAEFQALINEHSDKPATIDVVKHFLIFLKNRWKRIKGLEEKIEQKNADDKPQENTTNVVGTDFIYSLTPNQPGTLLSSHLATLIQQIQDIYIFIARAENQHSRYEAKEAKDNAVQRVRDDKLLDLLSERKDYTISASYQMNMLVITSKIRTLFSSIHWYNRAKDILAQVNRPEFKLELNPMSEKINSLLMPDISENYFYPTGYRGEVISFNNIPRDKFILTDSGKEFIPIYSVMKRAAHFAMQTGQLEYKTTISIQGSHVPRFLTETEKERLISHSEEVKNYHEAIIKSIEWKNQQKSRQDKVGMVSILKNFLNREDKDLNHVELSQHINRHLTGCDLLLLELDEKKDDTHIRQCKIKAKNSKLPLLIQNQDRNWFVFGDKKGDGNWQPVPVNPVIQSGSEGEVKEIELSALPFAQGKIAREQFDPRLIDTIKQGHSPWALEPQSQLYALSAYCSHCHEEKDFGHLLTHPAQNNIYKTRKNLSDFLIRHEFTLHSRNELQILPLDLPDISHEDPLIRATQEFEAAMQGTLEVSPMYGETGRKRLIASLYDVTTFPRLVQIFTESKQIADYLLTMPIEKISMFTALLPSDKLIALFNNPNIDDIQLARIWRYLSPEQINILNPNLRNDKLQRIKNGSEKNFNDAFVISASKAMRTTKKLTRFLFSLSDERISDFCPLLSKEKLANIFNLQGVFNFQLIKIWNYLSDAQKNTLVNSIIHPLKLENILRNQSDQTKEFESAKKHLQAVTRAQHFEETPLLDIINKVYNVMPATDLHLLTEFTHRITVSLSHPNNNINLERCHFLTNRFSKESCKSMTKGILLFVCGLVLITTAVLLAVASGGVSTPLSAAAAWMGAQFTTASVAALTVGSVFTFPSAICYLTRGKTYKKLFNQSSLFFNSNERESKREIPGARGSLNSADGDQRSLTEALLSRGRKYSVFP